MLPDEVPKSAGKRRLPSYSRICVAMGLVGYAAAALFVAFLHCSRVEPAPHVHPATAVFLGPFGLMPFHRVTFGMFVLAVALGMKSLFVAVLSGKPRWRAFAAAVGIAVWAVSALLVSGVLPT
jgi:hypothetical protein